MSLSLQYFEQFPELTTPRLSMRAFRLEDAPLILSLRSSDVVATYIKRPRMESTNQARELLEKTLQAYQNRQAIAWTDCCRSLH